MTDPRLASLPADALMERVLGIIERRASVTHRDILAELPAQVPSEMLTNVLKRLRRVGTIRLERTGRSAKDTRRVFWTFVPVGEIPPPLPARRPYKVKVEAGPAWIHPIRARALGLTLPAKKQAPEISIRADFANPRLEWGR